MMGIIQSTFSNNELLDYKLTTERKVSSYKL